MKVTDILNVVNAIWVEIRLYDRGKLLSGGYGMDYIAHCKEVNREVILIVPYRDLLLIYVE